MSDEQVQISANAQQLNGCIKIKNYRDCLRGLSNAAADVGYVQHFEKRSLENVWDSEDTTSPLMLFMADARDAILQASIVFTTQPINTLNVNTWFVLKDMVCCVNRLVTLPNQTNSLDISVKQLVQATAELLDIVTRLTGQDTAPTALPVADEASMKARYASIYLDLICARGSLWIAYLDTMARQLCTLRGLDYVKLHDVYARSRMTTCVNNIAAAQKLSADGAVCAYGGAILSSALVFDAASEAVSETDCPNTTCLDSNVIDTFMADGAKEAFGEWSALWPRTLRGNLSGYCQISGVSPLASVIMLPTNYYQSFASQYQVMLNAS